MTAEDIIPDPAQTSAAAEVERLLAEAAAQPAPEAMRGVLEPVVKDAVEPFDFRNQTLLSATELRKLRLHQEEFTKALAGRFSQLLRLEFALRLTAIQTISYQKFTESWCNPTHLTLFKAEPLRGVSILEIPPSLGSSIVDRLMGGPGRPPEIVQEMSEIERALLEQAVQVIVGEWCQQWLKLKELKPTLLGYENNGRFVRTSPPETSMLVIVLEAGLGDCTELIRLGFPYASVEPLLRQLCPPVENVAPPTPAKATPMTWNSALDEITIPVTAEWQGLELAAGTVLNLKIGDVLPLDPQCPQQVRVRLAESAKFTGRLGTVAGQWAVELTGTINR